MAAALGYLSVIMARHLPDAAVLAEARLDGSIKGPGLTKGMLKAARDGGINLIIADVKQVGRTKSTSTCVSTFEVYA